MPTTFATSAFAAPPSRTGKTVTEGFVDGFDAEVIGAAAPSEIAAARARRENVDADGFIDMAPWLWRLCK
jgi:hypothetical protein